MSEEITQIIIGFPNGIEKCKNMKYVLIVSNTPTSYIDFLQLTFYRVSKEE